MSLRNALEASQFVEDPRMRFSCGKGARGTDDNTFNMPMGLAFSPERGLLFVADMENDRVQVFSSEDGAFVRSIRSFDAECGTFNKPEGVAIDREHDRIIVADTGNRRVVALSMQEPHQVAFVYSPEPRGAREIAPSGVCVARGHQRIAIIDPKAHRMYCISAIDGKELFVVGRQGGGPCEFTCPRDVCYDNVRDRLIIADMGNQRVQALSPIDGSFQTMFGNHDASAGRFYGPRGVCVDTRGNVLVVQYNDMRLTAYTGDGTFLDMIDCMPEHPRSIAFDDGSGTIAFTSRQQVHVIGANQWIPGTYAWSPERHRYGTKKLRDIIFTITMIRSVVHGSPIALLPNELLFEIYHRIELPADSRGASVSRKKLQTCTTM